MNISFGDQLRKLRKQKDLTQQELGDKIGTRRQNIANWEAGNSEPSLLDLITLSHFFGVTIDFLVKGIEEKDETEKLRLENEKLRAKVLEFVLGGKDKVSPEETASELVEKLIEDIKGVTTHTIISEA